MLHRVRTREGLRISPWNRVEIGRELPRRNNGLALEACRLATRSSSRPAAGPRKAGRILQWPKSAIRFYASPWLTTARRYHTGNWLVRMLDQIVAKLWPLALMDDFSDRLQEGSARERVSLGFVTGLIAAMLIFQDVVPLFWVHSLVNSAAFMGHGALLLILASIAAGVSVLPPVLALAIPVMTRLMILGGVCALAASLCYVSYRLLLSPHLL